VDGDGNVVFRSVGYQPPESFSTMMNRALDLKHVPEWEKALKSSPGDMNLIAKLGSAAAMQNQAAQATNYANLAELAVSSDSSAKNLALYADLMNAVGDMFQTDNKLDLAIVYFEHGAKTKTDVGKVAYALYSEGYCYLAQNKAKEALDAAKRAEALAGLSKGDTEIVAGLEKSANQMLGKGGS